MIKKIHNKKWEISKISNSLSIFDLLDAWKKTLIMEAKLRKKAIENLSSFKKWYFTYLLGREYNDKVGVVKEQFKAIENKTDEQKDWLHERSRYWSEIEPLYDDEKLPKVQSMIVENEKKIRSYLKNKELSKYKTKFEIDFFQNAKHTLEGKYEFADNELGGIQALLEIYDSLFEDRILTDIHDSKGRLITKGSWESLFTSDDETVRKETYISYYTVERTHRQTLTNLMFFICWRMNQMSSLRKFKNEIEWKAETFYSIKFKEYEYIINQCSKFASSFRRWDTAHNKLIKEAYGLNQFEPWDSHLELQDISQQIDEKEAQNLICDSLASLGEDYVNNLKECFKKNIINWRKTDDNVQNGFCLSGTPLLDENPINFAWNGTVSSAITLSHELGHNLRIHYCKSNNEINNETDNLNEEISSIVNEFITMFYLIDKYKAQKNNTLLYGVYQNLFDYYFRCVSRNGLIANFRSQFCYYFVKNKDITPQTIEQLYLENRIRFLGMSKSEYTKACNKYPYTNVRLLAYTSYINIEENSRHNILGYYIGAIVALPIAYKIYHGDAEVLKNFMNFLKKGNSTSPFSVTKVLGVDILKPQIYTESKQLISKLISQFIKDIKIDVKKDPKE